MFNLYTGDVIRIAQSYDVCVHCYADDIQLYIHCRANESEVATARLLYCIKAIYDWLYSNCLQMNPDEAKAIWLGETDSN